MRYIVFTISMLALAGCNQIQGLRTNISAFPPEVGDNVEELALQSALRAAYEDCEQVARLSPGIEGQVTPKKPVIFAIDGKEKSRCVRYDVEVSGVRAGDKIFYTNGISTPSVETESTIPKNKHDGMERIIGFTNAGMTLSDLYCDRFFREANLSSRKRRFTRGLSNDVGGAIATALGLARVASGVVGGVAGGFAFADSSLRNYDESFMVDADLSKMRRLVLSAQDNMKLGIQKNPPETIYGAESKVIRYAGLCSFLGMKDLLNESVAEKTVRIEGDTKDKNENLTKKSGALEAEKSDLATGAAADPLRNTPNDKKGGVNATATKTDAGNAAAGMSPRQPIQSHCLSLQSPR